MVTSTDRLKSCRTMKPTVPTETTPNCTLKQSRGQRLLKTSLRDEIGNQGIVIAAVHRSRRRGDHREHVDKLISATISTHRSIVENQI